ncbi:phosphoglycerate dehydrogenase [Thermogemmatispora carboxidivorans]|uniref:phosphoglycerate dehydrogenase n=1 Tax=Thermogemmatispora carboxidivorans TaxID=1382306 RepID=UPI00069A11F0|nr:phosphoglycerate dehydrogenase [Thermogemmatispora carboxidivorans]
MRRRLNSTVLVTSRSFGVDDASLREDLEAAVKEVRYNPYGRALTLEELRRAVGDVDGIIAGSEKIDASVFAAAPRLRVIARYGVGVDNIDLAAAREHGVVVTNAPGANAEAVAELTIGFLFALSRSLSRIDRAVHAGQWPSLQGHEVGGKVVGLLGLGRIGQGVARRALALGCTVMAYDPCINQAFVDNYKVHVAPLNEVVAQAHFLSLHLPLTAETRGLVDRSLLERMRPGSYLINTARGELLVEEDLLWALESGPLRGAALDTLCDEPPPADHPFLGREDIILTSHVGAHTTEAARAVGRIALSELLAVLSGQAPRFAVSLSSEVHTP